MTASNRHPRIDITLLPKDEQEAAFHVENQLVDLHRFIDRFHAAILLRDHADSEYNSAYARRTERKAAIRGTPTYTDQLLILQEEFSTTSKIFHAWRSIAERDAIITTWDFCKTVYEIRNGLDRCKTLYALVERRSIEKAISRITKAFPDRVDTRDIAAHPVDYTSKTPEAIAKHSFVGSLEKPGLSIANGAFLYHISLKGGEVVSSLSGRVVTAKVNLETHSELEQICAHVYDAFTQAEVALKKQRMIQMGLPAELFDDDPSPTN